jgi:RHS repeat-associated protein
VQVKRNSTTLVNYRYDGDGRRVQEWTQTTGYNSTTTNYVNYIGAHAEVTAVRYQYGMGTPTFSYGLTKYYSAGAQRVAVRSNNNAPQYLLGDHLGSMSMSLNSNATVASEVRYKPFGYRRWASGTVPTHYQFTGQVFDQNTGLYFYNARFYDHSLGRFIQADTIVPEPGNPQALNRYSYVYNNPLKYTDPTGPCPTPPAGSGRVICVDLFIQVPLIADGDGHGDGLGFDPNSDSDKSTAWLYIYLAEDGKLIDTHYHLGVSETELGPYSPYYDEEYN